MNLRTGGLSHLAGRKLKDPANGKTDGQAD